jgi:hypothetical protein
MRIVRAVLRALLVGPAKGLTLSLVMILAISIGASAREGMLAETAPAGSPPVSHGSAPAVGRPDPSVPVTAGADDHAGSPSHGDDPDVDHPDPASSGTPDRAEHGDSGDPSPGDPADLADPATPGDHPDGDDRADRENHPDRDDNPAAEPATPSDGGTRAADPSADHD